MANSSKIFMIMVVIIAVAMGFGGGFLAAQNINRIITPTITTTPITGIPDNLTTVEEAWDQIRSQYVELDKLVSNNITASAVRGIIAALQDPHMEYMTAQEYNIFQSSFQGSFEGIGASVGMRDNKLTIGAPMKDSPAEKAGILAGDTVLEINGESTEGMNVDLAVSKIRGASGTSVKLLILHPNATELVEIEITRAKIEIASVEFEMRGDIALISIHQFTSRTEEELAKVMPRLAQEKAKGIILDLRYNPGGILDIVVLVASHFITDGVIVTVRSNQGVIETHDAVKQNVTTNLPMVVLVNEYSASGSEVLSGALQDYNRALISGNVTYGKGSVNVLQRLSDGSAIYITTSRWLTPDGHLIEGKGIQPDVLLEITGEEETQWAIDYLHGEIDSTQ
jgi:carboxyl-terminal processing protease